MPDQKTVAGELSAETVTEKDILFDCPHCAKSLVIDERAAGLVIQCPKCSKEVEVPQKAHVTGALEHHDAATLEEKMSQLETRMSENRMQHTETVNKLNDHITQTNRLKVRMRKLDSDYQKMEEELKALTKKKK